MGAAQWSPNGQQIAVEIQKDLDGPTTTFILNADGSNVRQVSGVGGQWSPMWSPDGTKVAFEYWTPPANGDKEADWDFHPIAVVDVASGALHEVGTGYKDGYLSWDWSPDGTSILEVPKDGVGHILIVDAKTGVVSPTPWAVDQAISWQRLAPD